MRIEQILQKYGLPRPMVVRPDDPSGWMVPFAIEAREICEAADASFEFLESRDMQAVAIQDQNNVVGVYAGMFWMLCRLATLVAASGVFPALKGIIEPTWTPDLKRSLRTPRDLLNEREPFDWQLGCPIPDDHIDPRRSALFMARSLLREVRDGRRAC